MLIENKGNGQLVITISSSIDMFGLQRLIDYLSYLEATSTSNSKQKDIDLLANEVNKEWWAKNKSRFI